MATICAIRCCARVQRSLVAMVPMVRRGGPVRDGDGPTSGGRPRLVSPFQLLGSLSGQGEEGRNAGQEGRFRRLVSALVPHA